MDLMVAQSVTGVAAFGVTVSWSFAGTRGVLFYFKIEGSNLDFRAKRGSPAVMLPVHPGNAALSRFGLDSMWERVG